MSFVISVGRELLGLFVDEGGLALQMLALIATIAAAVHFGALAPLTGAILLVPGALVILGLSLWRGCRR